jgi:lipoprotein-anchoring transpeptidase ErfK/SrfK
MRRIALLLLAAAALAAIPAGSAGGAPGTLVASLASDAVAVVRAHPDGPVLLRASAQTEFGSPRTFLVVKTSGRWLGVTAPELGNGRVGWVDAGTPGVTTTAPVLSVEVDLSDRQLSVREGARVVRSVPVGVGRPGSPTPTGRFSITDKLLGDRYRGVYGCCILALSGTQPNLPAGWTGGNRLAIHGTASGSTIARAASAGCLHAGTDDLRYLMSALPLGTPVTIRP